MTTPAITPEIELLANELWAQRADRPDRRADTLAEVLEELSLDLVKREEPLDD